jgi:hypothetical protein
MTPVRGPHPFFSLTAALLLAGITAPASAQDSNPFRASAVLEAEDAPQPPRTPQNAAWAYYKAWDTVTTNDDRTRLSEVTGDRPLVGKPLTKEHRQVLEKHRALIDGILAASAMDQCDWGSRTDVGLGALLPHLGHLRQSARVLALDAQRCAQDGAAAAAAERIVAMLRLSDHAASDSYLISKLVAVAIGQFAVTLTNDLLKANLLTAPAARAILTAIRAVNTQDLYRTAEALDLERRVTIDWFRKECTGGPDIGRKFAHALTTAGSLRGESIPFPNALAPMFLTFTEQRVQSEIDRADRFFLAAAAAWSRPDAAVALDELETQASELQWGFVTLATRGPFSTVRRNVDRMRQGFDRTAGRLRTLLEADAPQ